MSDLEKFIKQCRRVWRKMGLPNSWKDKFIQQLVKEGIDYGNISDEAIQRATLDAFEVKGASHAEKK